jgi:hypothetical protein
LVKANKPEMDSGIYKGEELIAIAIDLGTTYSKDQVATGPQQAF